jgi:hypothetical protein
VGCSFSLIDIDTVFLSRENAMVKLKSCILAPVVIALVATAAPGESWKFGLIADTQWGTADDGQSPNSVAVGIVNQMNAEFIRRSVKFVIALGDMTDNGSNLGLDTRATYAQALYNAGIGFYPLRGNHESTAAAAAEFVRIFPQTRSGANNATPVNAFVYTDSANTHPAAKAGGIVTVGTNFSSPGQSLNGLSYAFAYNNATFILLDQFTPADNSANTIDAQQNWISMVLAGRPKGTFAFACGHKGIITENHADNLFGASPAADSSGTNAFVRSLAANGAHYYFGGHDHLHNHSIVATTDGATAKVQEFVLSSGSYKFYAPQSPSVDQQYDVPAFGHTRETQISQDLYHVGYYIVTVDSPAVIVEYYGVAVNQINGDISTTPQLTGNWTKREVCGYSLNGREFVVGQGQSLTTVSDSFGGTTARVIAGTNTSTAEDASGRPLNLLVATGWSSVRSAGMVSNAVTLWGLAPQRGSSLCAPYTLAMKYDAGVSMADIVQHNLGLVASDSTGAWVNAVDLNSGGTPKFSLGGWTVLDSLGTWGVDTSTRTAWAVINHGGSFAVSTLGNVSTRQSWSAARKPGASAFNLKGRTLMVHAGLHPTVTVELFSLSGQLLRRVPFAQSPIDLTPFCNRAIIVRSIGAAKVTTAIVFIP